jgi:hypothetical protein
MAIYILHYSSCVPVCPWLHVPFNIRKNIHNKPKKKNLHGVVDHQKPKAKKFKITN